MARSFTLGLGSSVDRLDGETYALPLGQVEAVKGFQHPVRINGFHDFGHDVQGLYEPRAGLYSPFSRKFVMRLIIVATAAVLFGGSV